MFTGKLIPLKKKQKLHFCDEKKTHTEKRLVA